MDEYQVEGTNGVLIYEYTGAMLSQVSANIASLDGRLGTCIAFAGLLLRFGGETEGAARLLLLGGWGLAALAVVLGLAGFLSRPVGAVMKPEALLEEYYFEPEGACRLSITRAWAESIEAMLAWRAHSETHWGAASFRS